MHKKLEWFFLVLSAGVIWMSNPPDLFGAALSVIGLRPGTYTGGFAEGLVIGVALVAAQAVLLQVYERLLLPFSPHYKGGIWMYSFRPKRAADRQPTVGLFRIRMKSGRLVVEDGVAYWASTDGLKGRGRWTSRNLSILDDRIDIIYQLEPEFEFRVERSARYEGHIRLERREERKIMGKPHRGYLTDLEERSHVRGPIYAERIRRFQWGMAGLAERLESNRGALLYKLETNHL